MQKNPDGTVIFTRVEMYSLSKVVRACHDRISCLVEDGDFLGWNNYRALQMWDEKLQGNSYDLSDFLGDDEEENDEDNGSGKKKPATVDEWLASYGEIKMVRHR